MSVHLTPSGWYPDPERPGVLRFWDGSAWTEHRAADPVALPPPVPAPPLAPEARRRSWIIIGSLAVIVGAVAYIAIASQPSPEKRQRQQMESALLDRCETAVIARLKAPSTADIGGQRVSTPFGMTWTAYGWVDAENGFGAKVRTDWKCVGTASGTTFTTVDVSLSQR